MGRETALTVVQHGGEGFLQTAGTEFGKTVTQTFGNLTRADLDALHLSVARLGRIDEGDGENVRVWHAVLHFAGVAPESSGSLESLESL